IIGLPAQAGAPVVEDTVQEKS
ncbi:MAG: hypothetical protein UR48_C0044G0008, partial [Microgenomates group bacterium GW2011_GWD1_33_9]